MAQTPRDSPARKDGPESEARTRAHPSEVPHMVPPREADLGPPGLDHGGEDLASSLRLRRLEPALLGLGCRCHAVHVGALSAPGAEFCHHGHAAALVLHRARVRGLLEQRARLLLLHEYARRCRAARRLRSRLAGALGAARLLAADGDRGFEGTPGPSRWNLGIGALCEELRAGVGHRDPPGPWRHRGDAASGETPRSLRRSLWLLESQASLLAERCIGAQLRALASARPGSVPGDALEDLASAVELYNRAVAHLRSRRDAALWASLLDASPGPPAPISLGGMMKILAQRRAHVVSRKLHHWAWEQTELVSLTGRRSAAWGDSIIHTSDTHTSKARGLPLSSLTGTDDHTQDVLETFFRALASSTDQPSRLPTRPSGGVVEETDPGVAHTCSQLLSQYSRTYWAEFPRAFTNHFYYYPSNDRADGGVTQWSSPMVFLLLEWLRRSSEQESVPEECKDALQKMCRSVLSTAAFTRWDEMMCKSLGSGLKEKCLPGAVADPSTVSTATMNLTLQLFPPLLSVLQLHQTPLHTPHHTPNPNSGETMLGGRRSCTSGLLWRAQASIQSSTFWVLSKAHQFLASWSVCKFLLVTQGDLKVLRETVEALAPRLQEVYGAEQRFVSRHEAKLTQAVSQLQAFSGLVLWRFSVDCKKMSLEIFQQTMPSAKHWRACRRPESPGSPSEYAEFAARSVMGPVLEGVQPLPEEARTPALVEAVTAFVEAWMEHILKHQIKFSVQGALQLKRDFDRVREFLRSEEFGLSEELLSLHVLHRMDGAIVCLLQQPAARAYTPPLGWEPFRRCCPNTARVVDQSMRSLNNLEIMENPGTHGDGSSTAPPESYLAVAQQEWLDLRIHTGSRWRIPGLRCFSKSES